MVDDALDSRLVERFEGHVDRCPSCFRAVANILRGHSAVQQRDGALLSLPPEDAEPSNETPPVDIGRRYLLLSLIGQGGMGQVYRATDRLTGRTIALKRVLQRNVVPQEGPRTSFLSETDVRLFTRCLEQEFRVLSTLRHPNIISVLDYGFDEQLQPFFTMELLSNAKPLIPFALTLPLSARVELLLQLLHALSYLHRRGVLHRDLKPTNLLVISEPNGGLLLKVLDFGLSSYPGEMKLMQRAGTLGYMAPELLCGAPPSTASDLYAVGMVAYELLAEKSPFSVSSWTTRSLITVLREPPDLSMLPPSFAHVVGRTLSKRPEERPADVTILIRQICDAAGIRGAEEPTAIRESFLAAARFVGRESELATLSQALADARVGNGSAWLLGGDSGIGKSRLLDELRSVALVGGVVVARGQGIAERGSSHQVWQEVFQVLALHVPLSDKDLGVLETIRPGVATHLDRQVILPQGELDAQAARLHTLRVLREILLRMERPVLIILEDLHWADAESLTLLSQVSSSLAGHPLLIVGSYRNDEAPQLSDALPFCKRLRLGRFQRHEVAQLCRSIIGLPTPSPSLLDFLEHETEGNALFIVEVLRALAEEAGALADIGRRGLPQRSFAGGVESVLARRLERVPAQALKLLQHSAVMGRQLDMAVLATLYPDRDELIQQCADLGVLEVHDQGWRFCHDKLREHLLANLTTSAQCAMHGQIADSIEQTYAEHALPLAQLARHHHQAAHQERAAHYYELAGSAALARGAPAEALTLLEHAMTLQKEFGATLLSRAKVWRGLAQARYSLGQLHGTDHALRQVCMLVGSPLPKGAVALTAELILQAAVQISRLTGLQKNDSSGPVAQRALDQELLRALLVQEIYVWLCQPGLTLLCSLRGLELAERLDAVLERTYFRAAIAFLLSFTRLGGVGLRYLEQAPPPSGTVAEIDALRIQTIVALHRGHLSEAGKRATQAVACARALKDDFSLMYSLFQQQLTLSELSEFSGLLAISRELEQLALSAQNPRYIVIGVIGQMGAFLNAGQLSQVEESLQRACLHDTQEVGAVPESLLFGLAAWAALWEGKMEQAYQRADRAYHAVRQARWPMLQLRHALVGILEVYLDAMENSDQEPTAAKDSQQPKQRPFAETTPLTKTNLRERIEQMLQVLRWCAMQFHSMEFADALYRGRYNLYRGKRMQARSQLRSSLSLSCVHGGRFEQAQAHYWLGRSLITSTGNDGASMEAVSHLQAALAVFEQMGLTWSADRVRLVLPSIALR